ncbi:hypothetical protein [uncultured Mucilaginibacter sp.]|uniref:hypothetical protein n=1 Tax=uncultured Mucilaginibacter sp. TaxID=797541 RepID=UPI0025FFFC4F|nr:hypothetical protein [uncultured Mucilaginibacter sp.]
MDLQAEKLDLLQAIISTNDESLIRDIQSLLKNRDADWFDELNSEQQADVLEGILQLDNGKSFDHEEAKKRFGMI